MQTGTLPRSKWPRRFRLIWFSVVVGLGLGLQILSELFFKGLGMGVANATTALTVAPVLALVSVILTFVGLFWSGFWRAVRAAGYAAVLHILMTGWVWLTISTASHPDVWINENPRSAGILTLAAGALLLVGLRLVSARMSKAS